MTSTTLSRTASLQPLRITHIDTGLGLRGGQRQMLMLAKGLRERGHEQAIVCLEGSSLEERAQREGFGIFSLPAFDPGHALGVLLWRRQLQTWAPEILHAHDGRGQTLAWLASLGLPVRRVASRRVTFFPSDRWTYRLKYGHTCHAVIAVSENIRDLSVQAGVPRERIAVIPDGVEIPAELPSATVRQRLRTSWQFEDDNFVLGFLGASTPEKGLDVALAALNLLSRKLPKVGLVLAGDDIPRAGAWLSHGANPVVPRIIRLCPIEDLAKFFPGLDLFIMPSKAEGLGSSALLAMANGIPVVATRVGGLPEIVVENETGWLIPPGSPQALADAIFLASRDRAKLIEFGRHGRQRAEGFSAAIMVSRTEALYRQLVSCGLP
ncbi:MAG: glycosyltransferase family 4 protein [Terriglobia bacterium]|jgi:glycosyltransferase involved in cell wall biosynthesis